MAAAILCPSCGAAKNRRRSGVVERWRVNELGALLRVGGIGSTNVEQAAPSADDESERLIRAEARQPSRGECREPGVEPMVGDVECAEQFRLEMRRRKLGERRKR